MNCYFISRVPAHVFIRDKYLGKVDKNLSLTQIGDCDSPVLLYPSCDTYYPQIIDIFDNSKKESFDFLGGKLICPTFSKRRALPYKVIGQTQTDVFGSKIMLTVTTDGCVKMFLDGLFYTTEELPFVPQNFCLKIHGDYLIAEFVGVKTCLIIYNINNGQLVYKDVIDEYFLGQTLTVRKNKNQFVSYTIIEEWEFKSPLALMSRKVVCEVKIKEINEKLFNCVFFRLLTEGYDCTNFLTKELANRQNDLKEFIGTPKLIFPSPQNVKDTVILDTSAHIYSVETQNGLISNVIEK